jgi:hypothetical protein
MPPGRCLETVEEGPGPVIVPDVAGRLDLHRPIADVVHLHPPFAATWAPV